MTEQEWLDAHQRLFAGLASVLRSHLERHHALRVGAEPPPPLDTAEVEAARRELPSGVGAIDLMARGFGLSSFEQQLLTLCAAVEQDPSLGDACAIAAGDERRPYPTFRLAMAAIPGAHWSAITPAGSLRRYRLIDVAPGEPLATARLRIEERVLHLFAGLYAPDPRLHDLVERLGDDSADALSPSHAVIAERIAAACRRARPGGRGSVVQLCGPDAAGKIPIAFAAARQLDRWLHAVRALHAPMAPSEREALAQLWDREAVLEAGVLLLECDDSDSPEVSRAAAALAERVEGAVIVATREPLKLRKRPWLRIDCDRPTADEQAALWTHALGPHAAALNGELPRLVAQFSLSPPSIRNASVQVLERLEEQSADTPPVERLIWEACRVEARPRLDDLAQRIEQFAGWDDIVLPPAQMQILRDVAAHVRQRFKVYQSWGFGGRGARGLGVTALFAGISGTGKTMAAEVIAHELKLDLYRIDLSQVVNKYIGETEKNLRRIFDAAEDGGAILLFDEADALFGKRSEVRDSHDRYANLEVSYLLQRMEAYRGLAVLTTNMRHALDTAFLRRLRFVVEFPFPDAERRAEIWRRVFPKATPTEALDADRLARLNVSGGIIRNIALNAAFLAADEGAPVRMGHLLRAARTEYVKLEKPLTDAEVGGWV